MRTITETMSKAGDVTFALQMMGIDSSCSEADGHVMIHVFHVSGEHYHFDYPGPGISAFCLGLEAGRKQQLSDVFNDLLNRETEETE